MYNNQVRVGNWVEDQNGAFALQKDGTKDSVYQKDYGKRAMQARECKTIWKIREKGQVNTKSITASNISPILCFATIETDFYNSGFRKH